MAKKKTNKQSAILKNKWLYIALFLLSAVLLFFPIFLDFDIKNFTSLGLFGVFLFNFLASSTLFFPAPGFIATGIGGSLYNPILVALASSIGASLGEGVGFAFGYSSKKISHPVKHGILESLYKIVHSKYGPFLIILFAFIPNPFFDAVGIIAGLALYPLKKFLMLVFIGRFARDLIVAYSGQYFL